MAGVRNGKDNKSKPCCTTRKPLSHRICNKPYIPTVLWDTISRPCFSFDIHTEVDKAQGTTHKMSLLNLITLRSLLAQQ